MKIHIFPFSAREGTPAAGFPDQICPRIKKERCERLAVLERELAQAYYASLEGAELEVLAEQPAEDQPGVLQGTDRRYVPVRIPGTFSDLGQFIRARGTAAETQYLSASRMEEINYETHE